MLARTSYRDSFYTSLSWGGVSNILIINELTSKDKEFRLRSVHWATGGNRLYSQEKTTKSDINITR